MTPAIIATEEFEKVVAAASAETGAVEGLNDGTDVGERSTTATGPTTSV